MLLDTKSSMIGSYWEQIDIDFILLIWSEYLFLDLISYESNLVSDMLA